MHLDQHDHGAYVRSTPHGQNHAVLRNLLLVCSQALAMRAVAVHEVTNEYSHCPKCIDLALNLALAPANGHLHKLCAPSAKTLWARFCYAGRVVQTICQLR